MFTTLLLVLAQAATATPAQAPPPSKLSGGFNQKAAASGKAKLVITDDTLAPTGRGGTLSVAGARTTSPVGTAAAGTAAAPAAGMAATPAAPTDDETTWKTRVAGLRADLAKAQKEYDALDRANTVTSFGEPNQHYYTLMAIRDSALAPSRIRLAEIRSALAALPEECRKTSGCQPGWVR